jgi:hypothetical protein
MGPIATQATEVPVQTNAVTAESTEVLPGLTVAALQGAKIASALLKQPVQLTGGKFESDDANAPLTVELLPQTVVADLNGDGQTDVAALVAENGGGSGTFVYLEAFLATADGFTQSDPVLIDDRPQIQSFSVTEGKIVLEALIHGENDPMASPSLAVNETYTLMQGQLVLTGLSQTISGTERRIDLDLPTEGSQVETSVEVKGSLPVSPFENNLRYRFYDQNGEILNEGPITVQASDVGQPGSFDVSLTVPAGVSGERIRLEIADISAKDGSPICLASVDLNVK